MEQDGSTDVAVIGAGAAGLFAALAARGALAADGRRAEPDAQAPRVVLLDGQTRPGKKLLISGGGRCNLTNRSVEAGDFRSERPNVVRSILREFPVDSVLRFFTAGGIELIEEPFGKLFPRHGRAAAILEVLREGLRRAGVPLWTGRLVTGVSPGVRHGAEHGGEHGAAGWQVEGTRHEDAAPFRLFARRVIVATGGLSVPSTGSRGFGLELAAALGHRLVTPVPALAPLRCARPFDLAGVTLPATLFAEATAGRVLERATGSMLFTHDGVSGPVALDLSGAVERGLAMGAPVSVFADLWGPADPGGPLAASFHQPKLPGSCLRPPMTPCEPRDLEGELTEAARRAGRQTLGAFLAQRLPRRVVQAVVAEPETPLAALTREARHAAAHAVCRLPLEVTGTSGYAKAEVTAGGVDLAEVERRTLESRRCPGLHFCGEVLDVTGRLGGFNFQWAWSSGFLAGRGAGQALRVSRG